MTDEHTADPAAPPAATDPSEEGGERAGAAVAPDEVETLRRERDEYYDRYLRKVAEFDNYRKRVERERQEQAEEAARDILAELLPIVDDLERALEDPAGSDPKAAAYRRGVEMIHGKLLALLRAHGVRPIDALGSDFDPRFHEAVVHEPSPGHREGEVVGEFRRGYLLGDRLLRASMVKVAKA